MTMDNGFQDGGPMQFWQKVANFQQKRLLVLNILILPLNFLKTEIFQPQSLHFEQTFSDKKITW